MSDGRTELISSAGSGSPQAVSVDELVRLVDAGADWIWETNRELRFSWLSDTYQNVTGIAPEEVVGRFSFDLVEQISNSSSSPENHLANIKARAPFRDCVCELTGGKQECRWISLTGYPRFDRDGIFVGYRGIGRNVTSVKAGPDWIWAMEQELGLFWLSSDFPEYRQLTRVREGETATNDRLVGESHAAPIVAALNVLNEGVTYYDSDGRLIFYNKAVLNIYRGLDDVIRPGVPYEELHETGVVRGLWRMSDSELTEWRQQMLCRHGSQKRWNTTINTSDGRWIMHREMRTQDGGTIVISADITDLKDPQQENPGGVIPASAGEPDEQRTVPICVTGARVLIFDDNAVNGTILSEQMASWGFESCAAENGEEGISVLLAAADLGIAVDCVVLEYRMAGVTGADVARIIRSSPSIADTPIVMLTSVDQSLSNSTCQELGIQAQLIKPAHSSALLETVVNTIQNHRHAGGKVPAAIEATPQTEAESSLPSVPPAGPIAVRPSQADGHRLDILVAEDNEVNQLVFTQILANTHYSFHIVGDGRRAVESFKEMAPRMILMAMSLPEMNCFDATATIRALEAGTSSHVPIVGVMALALSDNRERCLDGGMDDYLPKPISPQALLEKVEKWTRMAADQQRSARYGHLTARHPQGREIDLTRMVS